MNTFGPLTRISPSSAIFTSHWENGLPTVPNLNASGREIVAAVDVSVMPQPSTTRTPAASKKRRMSGLIGAAPVTASFRLPPKSCRIFERTSRSARSYCVFSSGPADFPARSLSRTFLPTPMAQLKMAFLAPPSFSAFAVAAV